MGSYVFLLNSTFSRMSLKMKPLTPLCLYDTPIKRYNQASKFGHHEIDQERAPSTAEEFKRVAEEKLREAEASQVSDETYDGAGEATMSEPSIHENVKKRCIDHDADDDHGRKGDR